MINLDHIAQFKKKYPDYLIHLIVISAFSKQ